MSDFELLSVVLMVLGIIVTILISYIESTKKNNHHAITKTVIHLTRGTAASPAISF